MTKQLVTQMSVSQYDELITKILNGSLKEKWSQMEKPQTKKDEVEEKQIRVIGLIFGDDKHQNFADAIKAKKWKTLKIWKDEKGILSGELLG